jgi:hypothetical protein
MLDFTGTRFDFTVCSGLRETVAIRFFRAGTTEGVDLSGAAFMGRATERMTGTVVDLPVEHGSEKGALYLTVPELRADEFEYELYATDSAGEVQRMLYGTMTAISSEHAASLADSAKQTAQRTLLARLPDEVISPLELRWSGSSVTQKAAQDAADSAREAQEALDEMEQVRKDAEDAVKQAQDALGKLNALDARLAEVEGHITSAIVPNPVTNTWWICGSNTGYQVTGDPGKSPRLSAVGTWMIWNVETQEWDDTEISAAGEDGHSPYVNAAGNWCEWSVLAGEYRDTGLPAAGKDGIDGARVRRIIVPGKDHIPQSGETCNGGFYYYCPWYDEANDRHFDVYAWLESDDGSGSWVCVGEANDIATAEIYGLVRLGTDTTVQDGAPVGNDAAGQMSVPHADFTTPGTVRLATADVLAEGGAVGFDAEGRMVAQPAAYGRYGTMKPSANTVPGTWCIGINSDGTAGVNWAGLNSAGVVKLGSKFGQSNPIPYQQGVGATEDHKLANNLVFGGALQHMSPSAWGSKHMDWLDSQMSKTPEWFGDAYYLGLATSGQFTQSQTGGLELQSAAADLLAGVFLASSMTDGRGNAVPGAAMVLEHLDECYYKKEFLFTKEEVNSVLRQYVTKVYADSTFAGKTELDDLSEAVIHKTDEWVGDVVVTEEEYNGMTEHNPKIKYYIV